MAVSNLRIQVRRDTASNWASVNPVLLQGEQGLETDTGKVKYGNGSTVAPNGIILIILLMNTVRAG